MSQRIGEGAIKRMNGAQVVAFVARVTLAEISTWTDDELDFIGWNSSKIVERLYELGSTGNWVERNVDLARGIQRSMLYYLDVTGNNNGIKALLSEMQTQTTALNVLTACVDGNRLKTIETP